jgi:hypothetical protein
MSIPKTCSGCHLKNFCVIKGVKGVKGFENLKLDECDYLKWWADGNETEEGFDEYAESEIKRMKGEGK